MLIIYPVGYNVNPACKLIGDPTMFGRKRKSSVKSFNQPLPNYEQYLHKKLNVNEDEALPTDTNKFQQMMDRIFGNNDDFKIKIMMLPSGQAVCLYYFNHIIDDIGFQRSVIAPLAQRTNVGNKETVQQVKDIIYSKELIEIAHWKDAILKCLSV